MSAEHQLRIYKGLSDILAALPRHKEDEFVGLIDRIREGVRHEDILTESTLSRWIKVETEG